MTSLSSPYKEWFSFDLDIFQINAIQAIMDKKHALVTAHTGSGKTIPAEFAVRYFHQKQKRIIYTSPIKSLSNQKYNEFTKQFPNISFGILTGDIKYNPDADVLIMTTEILRNILFHHRQDIQTIRLGTISFQINMADVGCIIFDEVHYINDQQRGKVWEECIMNSPKHIQLVMLSATIDRASYFANWVSSTTKRKVEICGTNHRVVPLVHYSMLSIQDSTFTKIAKKDPKVALSLNHTMIPIKEPSKTYREKIIHRVHNIQTYLDRMKYVSKPTYVLNDTIKILRDTDKLPAICFVFSRKKAEEYARQISINLHDSPNVTDDTRKTSKVHQECMHIIRKLNNHQEYSTNIEYQHTISLLEKGIAVHHSGILPILREMIELLFSKGYIKCLFATETFAVGINMPTKTVIFTSLKKYDGVQERYLYSHEYTQMAGRAGRRGLDPIGHVIHLHSMFEAPTSSEYALILSGKPQTLHSKFDIDFPLIIRCMRNGIIDMDSFQEYYKNSMLQCDMDGEIVSMEKEIHQLETKNTEYKIHLHLCSNPIIHNTFKEYLSIDHIIKTMRLKPKQLRSYKEKHGDIETILINEFPNEHIQDKINMFDEMEATHKEIKRIQQNIDGYYRYFREETQKRYNILQENGFIHPEEPRLRMKGLFTSYIQECNCLLMGDLYTSGYLHHLNTIEMIQVLSCFTDIRVRESYRIFHYSGNEQIEKCLERITNSILRYSKIETHEVGYMNDEDYYVHYDLIEYMNSWVNADTEEKVKYILSDAKQYGIFQGEFVKAILKINAIAEEIESFCDEINDNELKKVVSRVSEKTLKYIATNQSLYV